MPDLEEFLKQRLGPNWRTGFEHRSPPTQERIRNSIFEIERLINEIEHHLYVDQCCKDGKLPDFVYAAGFGACGGLLDLEEPSRAAGYASRSAADYD